MIERIRRRIRAEGIANVDARVADVYDLPFADGEFDLAYLIAVIGEIPDTGAGDEGIPARVETLRNARVQRAAAGPGLSGRRLPDPQGGGRRIPVEAADRKPSSTTR